VKVYDGYPTERVQATLKYEVAIIKQKHPKEKWGQSKNKE
jgi:hypothetical protein